MTDGCGQPPAELRVDGGASVMDLLLQLQADQLDVPVTRPAHMECTALGAAYLAGLAEGYWADTDEVVRSWTAEARFTPVDDRTEAEALYARWAEAVERSRSWAH